MSEDVKVNEPTRAFSQTVSETPAYWQAESPPEFERDTGDMDDDWVE